MAAENKRRGSFSEKTRTKVLLWSDRHCCICKKSCGMNIEVHHIIPIEKEGTSDIDNAIPLCFECHAFVEHYNAKHPRGNKFKKRELKARREQVYDEFTRHLVPPIHYRLTQNLPGGGHREFPDVGFEIAHRGDSLPVKVCVLIENEKKGVSLGLPEAPGDYTGDKKWNLNPGFAISGHFRLPNVDGKGDLTLRLLVTVIDAYEREHENLPVGYRYDPNRKLWILEPASRDK